MANSIDLSMEVSTAEDWLDMKELGDDLVCVNLKPKPKEKYPAKLHAKSVAKNLGVDAGLIYLPGLPSIEYEDSDQPAHFRQRRYFYYLSGLNIPSCAVTYDIRQACLKAWIPPPNSGSNVIFNGQRPTTAEIKAEYDFDSVHENTKLSEYLTAYVHAEPEAKVYLLHRNQTPLSLIHLLHPWTSKSARCDSLSLKPAMDAARAIKSSYEIKMIRKASVITAEAHTNVLRGIKFLDNEAEVEAIFTATCISEKAKQQAYGVIAPSGVNASTLHYVVNNEPLKGRQLLCLDAGCEWKCYACDVTRTFPISGKFTPEAKAIYDLVAKMQEECISMVRPGANYRSIHMHAHKVALEGLMDLGLIHNGTFEEAYSAGATVAFFPHGLGHYLGLECHDVGDGGNLLFSFQRKHADWASAYTEMLNNPSNFAASILAPNHVITVEPGIYFNKYAIEEVWLKNPKISQYINTDLLEKYYPVGGVRIEDDILVTNDGYENLTTAPKGDEALKIINESKEDISKKSRWFW